MKDIFSREEPTKGFCLETGPPRGAEERLGDEPTGGKPHSLPACLPHGRANHVSYCIFSIRLHGLALCLGVRPTKTLYLPSSDSVVNAT